MVDGEHNRAEYFLVGDLDHLRNQKQVTLLREEGIPIWGYALIFWVYQEPQNTFLSFIFIDKSRGKSSSSIIAFFTEVLMVRGKPLKLIIV